MLYYSYSWKDVLPNASISENSRSDICYVLYKGGDSIVALFIYKSWLVPLFSFVNTLDKLLSPTTLWIVMKPKGVSFHTSFYIICIYQSPLVGLHLNPLGYMLYQFEAFIYRSYICLCKHWAVGNWHLPNVSLPYPTPHPNEETWGWLGFKFLMYFCRVEDGCILRDSVSIR